MITRQYIYVEVFMNLNRDKLAKSKVAKAVSGLPLRGGKKTSEFFGTHTYRFVLKRGADSVKVLIEIEDRLHALSRADEIITGKCYKKEEQVGLKFWK